MLLRIKTGEPYANNRLTNNILLACGDEVVKTHPNLKLIKNKERFDKYKAQYSTVEINSKFKSMYDLI